MFGLYGTGTHPKIAKSHAGMAGCMEDKEAIQGYINNFRRHLSPYLKPNIGLSSTVYPSESTGAIVEFTIGQGIANSDEFMESEPTVSDALSKIPQHAFGGELGGFHFAGTNVIAEDNRIILIKGGNDEKEWSDEAAQSDAKRVLPPSTGGTE